MTQMSTSTITQNNKQVVFVENHLPGLESGDYTLQLSQAVKGKSKDGRRSIDETFPTTQKFSVGGERFVLNASSIASVFPANNHQGDFSNCLPHITLNTTTFPWQRDLGKDTGGQGFSSTTPWIGLLAFTQEEAPTLQQVTLGTFSTKLPDGFSEQQILFSYNTDTKEKGDKDEDPCHVIDVPAALFNQLVPSVKDLPYLAHVREVDIDSKATVSAHYLRQGRPSDQRQSQASFSIVVGNRLLSTSGQYDVHLVSLENMGQYLPDDSTGQSSLPDDITHIRLVSLYSWSFGVTAERQHLSDIIRALDTSPITLKHPQVDSSQEGKENLNNVLDMGYVPLRHTLRSGDQTVSWYRGPLTPYAVNKNTVTYPQQCSDAWLQYDPTIGMFDISYASAWQLGRSLALQNKTFAQVLYRWKCANTQATIECLEEEIMGNALFPSEELATSPPQQLSMHQKAIIQLEDMIKKFLQHVNVKK